MQVGSDYFEYIIWRVKVVECEVGLRLEGEHSEREMADVMIEQGYLQGVLGDHEQVRVLGVGWLQQALVLGSHHQNHQSHHLPQLQHPLRNHQNHRQSRHLHCCLVFLHR